MRSLGLATIVVGALLLGAAAATAAPSSVIRGDTKIGTFAVQTDGSLAGAIRDFRHATTPTHRRGVHRNVARVRVDDDGGA